MTAAGSTTAVSWPTYRCAKRLRSGSPLVVLDCAFPGHLPPLPETAADAVFDTVFVTMRTQAVLEAPIAAAEVPVVYLPGPSVRRISPLDFTHTEALADEAYSAARLFLEKVRVDGPGLYGSSRLTREDNQSHHVAGRPRPWTTEYIVGHRISPDASGA